MTQIKKYITVKNDFVGYHRYADAPEDVGFLRAWHRHHFIVKTSLSVDHDNRDVEFFELQNHIKDYVETHITRSSDECDKYLPGICIDSCEMLAEDIANYVKSTFKKSYVRVAVSEDEECEAVVEIEDVNK